MAESLTVGDLVKINDGSQGARLDRYDQNPCVGLCCEDFEVLWVSGCRYKTTSGWYIHDIHIKSMKTGYIYLHSSSLVSVVRKEKEMTVAEISQQLGYTVKVIE